MTHYMKLAAIPFSKIAEGKKTIELRLNDEKRQKLTVGDSIVFTSPENRDIITATVKALHRFPDFGALYKTLSLKLCGYEEGETPDPVDMERYYTGEEIKKYGALGIELCGITAIQDVKPKLTQPPFLNLLAPSAFDPTEERLLSRAGRYKGDESVKVYALSRDGDYKGIVVFSVGEQVTIHDIAVDPDERKKGIGKALLNFVLSLGAESVTAETDDDALEFYKKCGFKVIETKSVYDTERYVCERRKVWESQ